MSVLWGKGIPDARGYYKLAQAVRYLASTRNLDHDPDAAEACWIMANCQARIAFEAESAVA